MDRFIRHGWQAMILSCLLVSVVAQAELTVIYDSGYTRPIASFLGVIESEEEFFQPSPATSKSLLGAADPETWLPITSPGLTPGLVQARSHDRPFARPFFLIGSDTWSKQWLQDHREQLKAIGAVGMLVQAETVADLQAIAGLADGLSILPASASDTARALGISHYPVLISRHGIEQ